MKSVVKKFAMLCVLASVVSLVGCEGDVGTKTDASNIEPQKPVEDWQLVWSDEFNGTEIDSNNWTHEDTCAPPNTSERQCYSPDAEYSYIEDGVLKIVALPTPGADNGKEYTSARMETRYKVDFTYGRFEIRAKLPSGQGSWPAFWMKATDDVYGAWPHSGEIDIMETVNLNVADADGNKKTEVRGVLHYGEWKNGSSDSTGHGYDVPGNPVDEFHTYAVEWQEGEIRWYVDDVLFQTQRKSEIRYNGKGDAVGLSHQGWYARYFDNTTGELTNYWDNAPFDQDFFMLLNYAVGGNLPENKDNLGVDPSAFHENNAFEIDYVRVYQCSLNPDTGKGCETIGTGLSNELIAGAAPNPPLPPAPPSENVTVSGNPNWAAWFSNGALPEVVTDAEKGDVDEFSFEVGAGNTVAGFITRDAFITDPDGEQTPHNASGIVATGAVTFDMKLVTPPNNADASWTFKIESDGGATAVSVSILDSVEGVAPIVGQWQSYTFPLQMLFDAGLDVSLIDVIMIYPGWSTGEGTVFRIANLKIGDGVEGTSAEVVLFEDAENPSWPIWNSNGDAIPVVVTDEDDEHGAVAEFTIAENAVTGFASRESAGAEPAPFDATSIVANGVMQFDLKVVNMPIDPSTVWFFKAESLNAATNAKVALTESIEGVAPTVNQWQTYTFNLSDLEAAGLDLSSIDVFLVYPNWGDGAGTVFRVDNAKIYDPAASGDFDGHVLFADQAEDPWSTWDCCGGSTPTLEIDDTDHGMTAEFVIGESSTLAGLQIADSGVYLDASGLLASGVVQFEMKVIDPITNPEGYWQIKMESGDQAAAHTFRLTDSQEGVEPVTGQWQTYTYSLQSFFDAGIDVSEIDILLISPNWSGGAGAKYRLDNVMIYDPSSLPAPEPTGPTHELFVEQAELPFELWDCCKSDDPPVLVNDDAEHGMTAEFVDAASNLSGLRIADDGVYLDASDVLAAGGVVQFDMKVIDPITTADGYWQIKMESGDKAADKTFKLIESQEGVEPVTGQWQTYTYSLQSFFDAGIDVSEIDILLISPNWSGGAGAKWRLDNVVIKAP